MRRLTTAIILLLFAWTSVHAEDRFSVSAGGGALFPVRGLKHMFRTGYGGTGLLELPLNDNISVLLRGGYLRWQFNSARINASVVAHGGAPGFDVSGPFEVVPALLGARLTFDGSILRPYAGIAGGACFIHWTLTGANSAPGATYAQGSYSGTCAEPAMSVDAGLLLALTPGLSLDIAGIYTAFSNANDRIEPSSFFGRQITPENTATFVGVQAGVRVGF